MADEINIIVRAEDSFSSVMGNFGNIMTGIKSTLDLVGQAFNAAWDFGSQFVQSAMESENVIADLEATLKSTGGAVGMTSQELQDLANNFQNVTKFSDETILSGEAMLLTFTNIGGDVFPQATEAMLNMAEKFGSVDAASIQLGKALNDPIAGVTALRRVGVQLSEDQENQIKQFMAVNDIAGAQGVILAELEKEFGGLAVAAGQTFAGQLEIAKNKLDNMKETIGAALLPVLGNVLDYFDRFAPALEVFAGAIAGVITGENSFSMLFATFEDGSNYLGTFFEMLGLSEEKANALGTAIGDLILKFDLSKITAMFSDWAASVDWDQLSNDIAAGIDSIDWVYVGQQIRTAAINIFNGLKTIVSEIDWKALGDAVGSALKGVVAGLYGYPDWDSLAVDFRAGLEYALVAGFGYMRFEDLATDFKNGFVYIGQQAKLGLAQAFGYTAFQDFATDLKEGFQVVINSIKNFLGISSPSTVFASIGKDIILGIIQGWKDTAGLLLSTIDNTLTDIGDLFGIDLSNIISGGTSAAGLGTASGGVAGSGTSGGTTGQVVNNYYGPVYFGSTGEPNSYYDCPSPNPMVAASGNQLVATGYN